jgi:hypothetical protein
VPIGRKEESVENSSATESLPSPNSAHLEHQNKRLLKIVPKKMYNKKKKHFGFFSPTNISHPIFRETEMQKEK